MDNKKIPTSVGTIVIIIITLTVFGVVWKYKKNQEVIEQSQIMLSVKKSAVVQSQSIGQKGNCDSSEEVGKGSEGISTNGWKLFVNKKEGYSIKYPAAWLSSFVDETSFFVKELRKPGEDFPNFGNVLADNLKNISGDYFINISVYKEMGTHVTLREWRKYDAGDREDVLIKGNPALKIDEKPHKSYDGKNNDIAGSLSYYFIDKNNNGYGITVWYKDSSDGIGERIISTLNILN